MARGRKKAEQVKPVEVYNPQAEAEKESSSKVQGGGNTVTVALCHPHGIQFILDGGKRRVKLNGNAANLVGQPKGILPIGGFGLTEISVTDWEAIKKTYGGMEIFKNGLCFAHEKKGDVLAEADEKAELRHGREPIQVDGPDAETKTAPADMSQA